MRVEVLKSGRPLSVAQDAEQVIIRDKFNNVICVCWDHGGGILAAHVGDDDFEDMLRILGLPGVEVVDMGPG